MQRFVFSRGNALVFSTFFAILSTFGCGRRYDVEEVSLKQSGIEIAARESTLTSDDWPSWRGVRHDGVAADQEVAIHWDENSNIIWRADIPGRGHSSPVVVGESVYLATAIDDQQQQRVISFDRRDGSVRWNTLVHEGNFPKPNEIHKKATNANTTIASDGRRLYVTMFNNDAIYATAIDLNGEIVWQKEVGKFVSRFGYAASPVLYRSLVIVAADHSGGGYISALDAETGKVAWRIKRGNFDSYSSPTVATVGGRDQLLLSGNDAVTSFDPATGEQLWQTECIAQATCGTIVTDGERIFASGGFPNEETVCLSADGTRAWSNDTKVYEPSLLVTGDFLFTVDDDGIAFCWDAKTGEQKWKKRLGGNFSASPIAVGNVAFIPNLEGVTHVVRVGDEFESLAKNRLGSSAYASLAVSQGDLFLRAATESDTKRQEQLFCIGMNESVVNDAPEDSHERE